MDYQSLNQAIDGMNDEQLFLIEKKAGEERKRRLAVSLGSTAHVGEVRALIDLAPALNAVREYWREQMSMASEALLASVLDQIKNYDEYGEDAVIAVRRTALSAALVHEAQCEMKRRLSSVK